MVKKTEMLPDIKIISAILGAAVIALAAVSGWLFIGQKDASSKVLALEKRIAEVSGNEKDTAKEVARMLREFDKISKKQAVEAALKSGAAPKFQLPLGCTPGVDFAIRDILAMQTGVPIFIAAPGRVVGVRDGMPDVDFKKVAPEIFKRGECGNGVRVSHGGNWFTQYCHMKKGSIIVKKGEQVEAGKPIGFVGLSGKTEFPHLHFQVSKGKKIVDPFIGTERTEACGAGKKPLWDDTTSAILAYQNSVIYNGGFNDQRPLADGVHRGLYKRGTLSKNSLKLFLWFAIRNTKPGDKVAMRLLGPGGKEIGKGNNTIKKVQARGIQILDVTSKGAWPTGDYRGEITVTRNSILGPKIIRARRRISIK